MIKRTSTTYLFIFLDWIAGLLAWFSFFYYRKVDVEKMPFEMNDKFYLGMVIIPLSWVFLSFLFGTYIDSLRMYLTKVIVLTFKTVFVGAVIMFFTIILDDEITGYQAYYKLGAALFIIHLVLFLVLRLLITKSIVRKVHQGKIGFNTLLIGGSSKAVDIYREITSLPKGIGNKFIGFINLNGIDKELDGMLPYLGHANNLEDILNQNEIEEVIIALESSEHERLKMLVGKIQGRDIRIKIIPDMFDILSGSVKMNNIFGALLIEVESEIMPFWQFVVKRIIDIVASAIAIILLLPVYIFLAIGVKLSSPGPIFFKQERIGKNGIPFNIIKFRTMFVDAEKAGPQLSSSNDPRITSIGKTMRKMRLDELPQFWNVLKGEMSLVGPRPERRFFIDQIVALEPQFLQLNKVKPGITSWGQVKFGYAENVDEMIQRMKFDLLYLKNMSIALDFKILIYTIIIVFKGTGK
jgi:exopolysaccharide biosynthesis polyprenyl glycosylphosphotransferase